MDEDDSQDELINRNTSHSKGKRAALWAISDDSDDVEEESEEGESDSGEEEEEGHLDGEDDEDEEYGEGNEEEDDEEEEEDAKAEDGAYGGTSADLQGLSSDEDTDKCPICLNSFNSQPVATPESCEHFFCLDCILEWAKNANSCPVDRIAFNSIYLRKCYGGKVKKMITVQKPVKEGQEERANVDLEQTSCEVCGGSDREDRLLLCDGCDAGYHMECLTPPLDSVPVEEWFCPECEANNHHSRGSAEEISDTESLPSTARPATSRSGSHAAGPTRAIARTQQSERVRANVNRHRITQARTSQLAPTYLIQSTWLDETINAVVAGLNTSVYIRDFTPRFPSRHRRRTGKRRKVKRKKPSSAVGKKGTAASTGVRRRKRKMRRSKSKKKLMLKKTATPRSRIANNLGIVKDKKGSSLPTVYRPSEHTLSGMRADIGAASLSIYGDPFDLDPFVDCEEEEQQAHVTSLLEAKRRGISRSALRSHQPVARPVTASLSRRGMNVPQSGGVVEAAPVPDLLGSILSGQSMLLMDSSDVVINRDGSLKAAKPMMPSALKPGCSSSSGDGSTQINPVMSPNQGDSSQSPHYNGDLPGSSHSSMNRPFSQSSSRLPAHMPSAASHVQPSARSDLLPRGRPSLQPPRSVRPTHLPGHRGTNGVRAPSPSSSAHPSLDSSSKSKGIAPSHSQPKKAPTKPVWVDVSVLPRIPKIKRESGSITNDGSNRSSSSRGNSSNSTTSSNGYSVPETGVNSLSGDKGRQQSVDRQKGRNDGQTQRQRPDGSGFSNSFSSSSSSSTGSSASQQRYSSSSSSSTAVSFRINSSGNSWQSRRMSSGSSSASGGSVQEPKREKQDEARRRQLHRDKQMLLASRPPVSKEQDSNNIYDPFNPTLSDSSSSDDEAESTSLDGSSRCATHEGKAPSLGKKEGLVQSKQVHVKTETQEFEISEEQPRRARTQETISQELRCSEEYVKVEKESRRVDTEAEKRTTLRDTKVKEEPGSDVMEDAKRFHDSVKSVNSGTADTTPPIHHSLDHLKAEKEALEEESAGTPSRAPPNCKNDLSASSSAPTKKKQKADTKSESKSCSESPSRDLGQRKKTFQASKERRSSSPETDRGRRRDHHASGQGGRQKDKDKDRERSSRRSRSRERRRPRSTSDSSQSTSPDRTRRKRQRSRSRSKDRRPSRSGSSSSSRERSRKKTHEHRSKERNDGREGDCERRRVSKDKRQGRSRSKSRSRSRSRSKDRKRGRSCSKSRSRSRSRSRERRKDHTRPQQSSLPSREKGKSLSKDNRRRRSRSSSRERRKEEGSSSRRSQKTSASCVSSSKDTKQSQAKKKEDTTQSSLKEEKVNKHDTPSYTAPKVKQESKDLRIDRQTSKPEIVRETKKEIKEEKQPFVDIFKDSAITKPIKKEETVVDALVGVEGFNEGNKEDPIKTETYEIPIIKSEPSSPELCHFPPVTSFSMLTTPVPADSLQDTVSQSHPVSASSAEQSHAVGLTVPVKQEVELPSDSDDDFNVDVMLDNLDYVKSEHTEGSGASVKQEKEGEEGKNESTAVGVKSKTQVKRVTWNIQEPEGPQPEKSASKLALYKLRLKQEGARRPSSTGQTSSQDIAAAVSDPAKKDAVGLLSSSSRSDGVHAEGLSTTGQGEVEDGDLSRKDKYLKKLHMQERAIEEVKLAIKPFYQRRDINKDEYKEILRKAVQKVCHSKSGEINPVKVGNLVKAYVEKYKHARKHKKGDDSGKAQEVQTEAMKTSDSP